MDSIFPAAEQVAADLRGGLPGGRWHDTVQGIHRLATELDGTTIR